MDGEIDPTELLDCVIFRTSSSQNSFEAFACNKEKREKVASGLLNKLELHLPVLRKSESDLNGDYRFQLDESRQGSSWFTKATLSRFLLIVNEPELFKSANTIQNELNQLEDTRRFHLMLYKRDNGAHTGGLGAGGNCLEDTGTSHQVNDDTLTSDITKNELLRALDVRVLALSEELASNFSRALGNNFSKIQLSELVAFVEYFGASELRDSLLKFISLKFKCQDAGTSNEPSSKDSDNRNEKIDDVTSSTHSKNHIQNAIKTGVSPAKIAQAERQISSESEDSDSSNDVKFSAERSRPAIRSASPRRSASPMRRIQIGRSGSRRSTALAIKSINYFPPKERTNFNRDGDDDSGDESPECQPKRSENAVLRMSVQDRINLFERKQKDQTSDTQERSSSTEATFCTKKSVLRRWSAGMGDSSTPCQQENKCDDKVEVPSEDLSVHAKTSIEEISDNPMSNSKQPLNVVDILSLEVESTSPSPINTSIELVASQSEGSVSRSKTSADWTRQKEAELEQMLKQMMQSKPAKVGGKNSGSTRKQGSSFEQKGNLYSQYKAKRDEKLHTEMTGKGTDKEIKLRVKQNKLDNRKAEVAAKVAGVAGKLDSSTHSQKEKTRRKSSPPVLSKTPATNSVSTRKASPRTLGAMPAGRNSIPSLPSTRSARTPSTKAAPGMTNKTTTNRKKSPQVMPSPTRPSPRAERPKQSKVSKDPLTENTPNSKTQEDKKNKMASKNGKTVKTKTSTVVDSSASPVKPSFYNKVTKKGTVVPLEPKPFLRKGTGVSAGTNATLSAKNQPPQPDSFSKHTESVDQNKNEPVSEIVVEMTPSPEENPSQIVDSVDLHLEQLLKTLPTDEKTTEEVLVPLAAEVSSCLPQLTELPIKDFDVDDDSGISSTAWVVIDQPEGVTSYEGNIPKDVKPADAALVTLCTSPRVRHSLSQMLQAESSEPDIVEWGNAEVPPALIYQKDAPKGLKRLLNFARKSKGDSVSNGWSSPSVFSEGEEDTEEPKAVNWKKLDASSGKLAFKTKASGLQRTMLSERHDSGNPSKSSTSHSASTNRFPSGPQGLREDSASTTSSKASRSFFSLSTFKSNK